ncbi:hypothetical protein [Kistimonas asteriae]|uniref:hypothetical protein n=1 Tax=Kistimonas asteriae TaxID=517724 RepID=UPI001BA85E65|nr:hypothetical protein [Kistimonas asteriae]
MATTRAQRWRVKLARPFLSLWSSLRARILPVAPVQSRSVQVVESVSPPGQPGFSIGDDSWKQQHYALKLDTVWQALQAQPEFGQWQGMIDGDPSGRDQRLQQCLRRVVAELSGDSIAGGAPGTTPRERYKRMITAFRSADAILLKGKHNSPLRQNSRAFLHGISRALFTTEIKSPFHSDLVQAIRQKAASGLREGLPAPLTSNRGRDLAARLAHTQQLISGQRSALENPASKSDHLGNVMGSLMAGEAGIHYDPYRQGNIPDILFKPRIHGKAVACIRMGTPTRQDVPFNASVTPEFRCFLESRGKHDHHLYINRQRRTGIEGDRSHALEKLQAHIGLQGKITVVTLPADGDFYNQRQAFSKDCELQALQAQMAGLMADNQQGFFFPAGLRQRISDTGEDFSAFLSRCLKASAEELGISQDAVLGRKQRQAFIFHFLNKTLVEALIQTVDATTYNHTCKDDIDRGGVANAYLFAVKNRPHDSATAEEQEAFAREMEAKTNAAAVEVKKREVIEHRHEDLRNALETLDYWNKPPSGGRMKLPGRGIGAR